MNYYLSLGDGGKIQAARKLPEDYAAQLCDQAEDKQALMHALYGAAAHDMSQQSVDYLEQIQRMNNQLVDAQREATRLLQIANDANRAKAEFISRISHDIRTPLSIISSMTDFALSDMHSPEKLENDLRKIKAANAFLLSLINDVLDISKIDSGNIELNLKPYSFDEYVDGTKSVLDSLCAKNQIAYTVTQVGEGIIIMADQVRLNQVTLNLVANAVKYTLPGGKVDFYAQAKCRDDGMVKCAFTVTDNGIGMSEQFQKRMYEPFAQEHGNPHRVKAMSGTGLGLAIVKKLVDLMDGSIRVVSRVGAGTQVTVEFLAQGVSPQAGEGGAVQGQLPFAPLTGNVLLVEDNEINTEIALRVLEDFGLDVTCAENGQEAVRLFDASENGQYCAVLMDIQMPVMDGYQATKAIRQLPRADARTVPIIAMTADVYAQAIEKGKQAGMNQHLPKPLDPNLLYQTLRRCTG